MWDEGLFELQKTTLHWHATFLYQYVKSLLFIIICLFWCWTMQKTFFFPRVSSLFVYCSPVPLPTSIQRYRQLAERIGHWILNNTSHILNTIQCGRLVHTLSTHFQPLYTNIYHIGPSDGAVSHYALRLKSYRATSIQKKYLKNTHLSHR